MSRAILFPPALGSEDTTASASASLLRDPVSARVTHAAHGKTQMPLSARAAGPTPLLSPATAATPAEGKEKQASEGESAKEKSVHDEAASTLGLDISYEDIGEEPDLEGSFFSFVTSLFRPLLFTANLSIISFLMLSLPVGVCG